MMAVYYVQLWFLLAFKLERNGQVKNCINLLKYWYWNYITSILNREVWGKNGMKENAAWWKRKK